MKFKVYNNDSRFGDSSSIYCDTLETAEKVKKEYEDELYDIYAEEVQERALDELIKDINQAIEIEEEEEEGE